MYKHAVNNARHYTTNLAISPTIRDVGSSAKIKRCEDNRRFLRSSKGYLKPVFKSMAPNLVETLQLTDQLINHNESRKKSIKVTRAYFVKFTHSINFKQ
jgi:hypothetical protein